MKYLNLGCGDRFHPSWTNIDFRSTHKNVIACNLQNGIPFADQSFEVVYHSHLLEHFSKSKAEPFMNECYRVLRPHGILRVVVPDLEQIAQIYLKALEEASKGSQEWSYNYQWILLEMYDQTVRNFSGGDMAKYLFQEDIYNVEFIYDRCGVEAKKLIEKGKEIRGANELDFKKELKKVLKKIYQWQDLFLRIILGSRKYAALKLGEFRQSGEIHQWMYDRYSLTVLFQKCGFQDVIQQTATKSYIKEWYKFNLDTEPDGIVYKPDSIFIEAIKPLE